MEARSKMEAGGRVEAGEGGPEAGAVLPGERGPAGGVGMFGCIQQLGYPLSCDLLDGLQNILTVAQVDAGGGGGSQDRKSTRLNSSH